MNEQKSNKKLREAIVSEALAKVRKRPVFQPPVEAPERIWAGWPQMIYSVEPTHPGLIEYVRAPSPDSIAEKAQRAAQNIWNNLDRTWSVEELVEIITAELEK